jgi:hypothetical protein
MDQEKIKNKVYNVSPRYDKTAWLRRYEKMIGIIENDINPLVEMKYKIDDQLQQLFDQVAVLKQELVDNCIHPVDMQEVIDQDEHVVYCGFCKRKLRIVNGGKKKRKKRKRQS